ncbi:enoyl-CoA hydratase/isomerase family protein [Sulfitobacter mediterraneus]|uniref:3-hydroxyacyl-CoA dehydrogenase NAD-binding domain-containing protein n=1 Tax=Sulfitobacter mediterraneus TaxID=83219 RepID=UPI0019313B67|nr:3-hydroxyacyl-CoA dehydrogenase NAD-binding domain-containing protein [Sulfitobacter mediterraneus]MBM1311140.1 enoyl-CoA hydratase/isomerase family protein [Sulfitobacter mediterraneus]MBM1315022.1 enoyl-CoA hydratase/isomerase family protein [Sulfitobacter mediterraneus]MBM1323383.1 enoyl-CoA hydratase/isomerase family protein [Sulfitobacter mediterraneus]MBM1327295.1 enoyl-CoA hydratase/isomerase family protein [Sulfitobacter mediterraneus]MBM1398643.1 enoyl-CoA hydratase/isomerase famil
MSDKIAYSRHGDIAVLRIQNPPVNALSQAVRQGLSDGMARAEADDGVRAVLILGDGRAFIAGADITEFGKPPMEPNLPDLCTRIEASPLLVVASMHGVSLGGGLEVALCAHYRIAQPSARVGLPEVHLGILPGAGGTQRLPRLTGAEKAVEAITTGRHIKAPEALEMGIVDRVEEGDPEAVGLAYTQELLDQSAPRRPVSEMPAAEGIDWDVTYDAVLKKGRGQISPATAVRAVQAASELPFAQGILRERELFMELMNTDQRKGMIHAFFNERAVSNLPELKGVEPRALQSIGVIGGGTMGAGIATAALLSGFGVVLIEMKEEFAAAARDRIADNLQGALKRGKINQAKYDALTTQALTVSTNYDSLSDVDLVIEAVFEDMAVKREVFGKLDAACKPGCVLASNTSYLDVNEIAACTSRPADVIGLHFFSPAHVMKLLEVVVADQTAPDVVATGFALGKALGKVSVRAGVCDGFIGNRILATYRTAADHMVLDGATPYQIDKALTDFGFAMGPFAVADLAGLDIGWMTRKRKAPDRHPQERVPTYIDRLCEQGHFGQKTGEGYYVYEKGKRGGTPNPKIADLIAAEQQELGITPRPFTDQEIVRRYMCAMVNEAAKVVGEGIARRPLDVDMTLLFGYGFPRYWGGPMKWADIQGLPAVLADIESYAKEDAWFWEPAPLLKQLASEGRTFDDLNKEPLK